MTDRKKNSTTGAHDEKSRSEQQDDEYRKMQKEKANYTIPRRTPDRPAAPGEADDARATRSRDAEKTTDGQPAGQQQRSGTHPPLGLAAALEQAADTVQATIGQAQQNVDTAIAMQQMLPPQGLIFSQNQPFYPPAGGFQQQYPIQNSMALPSLALAQIAAHQSAATSIPFGGGGYLPSGGYPPQPGGPCNATSAPDASLSEWRGGDEKY